MDVKQKFIEGVETTKLLTGLSQRDFDLLREAAPQARLWAADLVKIFYDTLYSHERTAAVFHINERQERENSLEQWYFSLFEVDNVDDFLRSQAHIGLLHIRRRVHNQFMVGIAFKVRAAFQVKAMATFGPVQGAEVAMAFDRVISAVISLTVEGYEVMSKIAFSESTGASSTLVDRLIQQSVDDVEARLLNDGE